MMNLCIVSSSFVPMDAHERFLKELESFIKISPSSNIKESGWPGTRTRCPAGCPPSSSSPPGTTSSPGTCCTSAARSSTTRSRRPVSSSSSRTSSSRSARSGPRRRRAATCCWTDTRRPWTRAVDNWWARGRDRSMNSCQ